jgi:glycosyltransferase involved in cell wall biosynthesis
MIISPDPLTALTPKRKIAIFLPSLATGGVARIMLFLAKSFIEAGHHVEFVLGNPKDRKGELSAPLPPGTTIRVLQKTSMFLTRLRLLKHNPSTFSRMALPIFLNIRPPKVLGFLPSLISYLNKEPPDILLSAKTHTNLVALWASQLSQRSIPVIISEHSTHSNRIGNKKKWRWRFIFPLLAREYPKAQYIISVSKGVKSDLIRHTHISDHHIRTIYNPICTASIMSDSLKSIPHPWFIDPKPPIILGVGRLVPAKDFPTLLYAFARVRKEVRAHLILLGEGKKRKELEALITHLGLTQEVWMPGIVDNPYAFMARASVLALSSILEGLPTVILEALACGCPVVSTDCPSGPAEILKNGQYGRLVPIGDAAALADAILTTLTHPPNKSLLQERALEFDIRKIGRQYLNLMFP